MRRSRVPALVAAASLAVLATLAPSGTAVVAAAKPAPVKVTLKSDGTGRVTSDRSACVSQVDVFAFLRAGGGGDPAGQTVTDAQGRYPTEARRVGSPTKAFTLVLGNARCKVAQSEDASVLMRAGKPAQRRVTLNLGQTNFSGRVSSKRAGCFKHVPVEFFGLLGPGQPWTDLGSLRTNGKGRFDSAGARLVSAVGGGFDPKVTAVALGNKSCRVAQSPVRTAS